MTFLCLLLGLVLRAKGEGEGEVWRRAEAEWRVGARGEERKMSVLIERPLTSFC